jgi:hypothetical protein
MIVQPEKNKKKINANVHSWNHCEKSVYVRSLSPSGSIIENNNNNNKKQAERQE